MPLCPKHLFLAVIRGVRVEACWRSCWFLEVFISSDSRVVEGIADGFLKVSIRTNAGHEHLNENSQTSGHPYRSDGLRQRNEWVVLGHSQHLQVDDMSNETLYLVTYDGIRR